MKLTSKEKEKIAMQMARPVDRGPTWVGLRSSVMKDKRKDSKNVRRENRKMCREGRFE